MGFTLHQHGHTHGGGGHSHDHSHSHDYFLAKSSKKSKQPERTQQVASGPALSSVGVGGSSGSGHQALAGPAGEQSGYQRSGERRHSASDQEVGHAAHAATEAPHAGGSGSGDGGHSSAVLSESEPEATSASTSVANSTPADSPGHTSGNSSRDRRRHRSGHAHGHDQNLNVRAAFIHVLGDLIQSFGVLIAAILIKINVCTWVGFFEASSAWLRRTSFSVRVSQ